MNVSRAYYETAEYLETRLSRAYSHFKWEVLRNDLPPEANYEGNFVIRAELQINGQAYRVQTYINAFLVNEVAHQAIAMIAETVARNVTGYLTKEVEAQL